MKTHLRRVGPWAAIAGIVAVLAVSIVLLALPATTSAATPRCSSVAAGSTSSDLPPSSGLDAIRQCGGNPTNDQSLDEAIVAGAGIVLFGGAMLVYRQRRTHHHGPIARA